MRRPVIAGNWKMYKTTAETRAWFTQFKPLVANSMHCDIVVCPPFTGLATAVDSARNSNVAVGAQNLHWEKEGAFTGEVSAGMLREAGCTYVIIGHSERRQFFHETDETVSRRLMAALEAGLIPIVCVGALRAARAAGKTEAVLATQFGGAFGALTAALFSRIIVAYEPVWAIGTGKTATPEMAAEAHRTLRKLAEERFGPAQAQALRILYGGSVKPDNIKGLMAQPEIDGALVGGASLKPEGFAAIVNF
jgi:triosephosphate isomerase